MEVGRRRGNCGNGLGESKFVDMLRDKRDVEVDIPISVTEGNPILLNTLLTGHDERDRLVETDGGWTVTLREHISDKGECNT